MDNNYAVIDVGPETYRPNFNAYMVAGARAIANVAQIASNTSLSSTWNGYAATLYQTMQQMLYDDDLNFWIDVVEGTNLQIRGRELIGYFPFRFDVGTDSQNIRGLETGLDTEHFLTTYGPTTLEQTNPYFTALKNLTYCFLWQGQSWPFSTSVYLGTLARIARTNSSSIITPSFFQQAMTTYTLTNYKEGVPFTAEAHYPTIDAWSGDTTNHSEHYFHSTYLDNVFTNLLGIIPTLDDRLEMRPLIPSNWTHFLVEDLPYHGTLFTVVWDQTGTHYITFNHSAGLSIYSAGSFVYNQATLSAFNLTLPSSNPSSATTVPSYVNILSNPNAPYGLPSITTDVTFSTNGDTTYDNAFKMINGLLWYDVIPDDFWTNNQSTTPYNTISITLPRPRQFSSLSLAILDDTASGGVLACPYSIQISTNSSILATRSPWTGCTPNDLNTISFDNGSVTTDSFNITVFSNIYRAIAISEIQIWVPANTGPVYEAEDGLLGTLIGSFEGRKTGMNASIINGGVSLVGDAESSWVEVADVRSGLGRGGADAGVRNVTFTGYGDTAIVGMNFLSNQTLQFGGGSSSAPQNVTLEMPFLYGGNVVTVFGGGNGSMTWIDAFVVG